MQIRYEGGATNTQDGLEKAKRLLEDCASGIYFRIVLLVGKNQNATLVNTNHSFLNN